MVASTDARIAADGSKPASARSGRQAGRRRAANPKDGVVRVSRDRKGRRGKTVTVISGLPAGREGLQEIAAALKRLCGSGGTVVDGNVEIQGTTANACPLVWRSWGTR